MTRKSKVLDSRLPRRVTWVNHLKLPQLQLPFSPKWAALNLLPLKKKIKRTQDSRASRTPHGRERSTE